MLRYTCRSQIIIHEWTRLGLKLHAISPWSYSTLQVLCKLQYISGWLSRRHKKMGVVQTAYMYNVSTVRFGTKELSSMFFEMWFVVPAGCWLGLSQLCSIFDQLLCYSFMLQFWPIMLLIRTIYAPNCSNYAHKKVKFTTWILLS